MNLASPMHSGPRGVTCPGQGKLPSVQANSTPVLEERVMYKGWIHYVRPSHLPTMFEKVPVTLLCELFTGFTVWFWHQYVELVLLVVTWCSFNHQLPQLLLYKPHNMWGCARVTNKSSSQKEGKDEHKVNEIYWVVLLGKLCLTTCLFKCKCDNYFKQIEQVLSWKPFQDFIFLFLE